jgi:zinc transport system substrate-binding protein
MNSFSFSFSFSSTSAFLAALLLLGCRGPSEQPSAVEAAGPPTVFAVNYPLAYFAERIGGDLVRVEFPVPADVDPAYWSPADDDIVAYQEADLVLLNGAGYAKWTQRVSLPASRLVDTSVAFADRLVELEDAVTHAHGPEGGHAHGEVAFTTWLDPTLAIEHARAIAEAFATRWPAHAHTFRANAASVETDLVALDAELETITADRAAEPLIASHPVYQYLARRYGLNVHSLHWEPDEPPDAGAWRDLDALLGEHPATIMVWEGAPAGGTAAALAERSIRVSVFEPCGNVPESGDYFDTMQRNIASLREALEAEGK